ncbi:MAG: hypothetical protein ACRD1C_10545 [Terriglobales bacterium]
MALVEQRGIDLRRRAVLKALLVKAGQYLAAFLFAERTGVRGGPAPGLGRAAAPVPGGARHRQDLAGLPPAHQRRELVDRGQDHWSLFGLAEAVGRNSLATFF